MVIEHAVAAPDGKLAGCGRVPGETYARRRIDVAGIGHAAVGHAVETATHQTVRDAWIEAAHIQRNWRAVSSGVVATAGLGEAASLGVDGRRGCKCVVEVRFNPVPHV